MGAVYACKARMSSTMGSAAATRHLAITVNAGGSIVVYYVVVASSEGRKPESAVVGSALCRAEGLAPAL
jgi:hypothetical protein